MFVLLISMTSFCQATIISIEGNTVTDIIDLDFKGKSYDVKFVKSRYSTLLNQGVDFIFLNKQAEADDFVDTINLILPDTFVFFGNVDQCNITPSCSSTRYFIPFNERLPTFYDALEGAYKFNDGPAYSISPGFISVFAIINETSSPSQVPEPTTFALMSLLLLWPLYNTRKHNLYK